MIGIINGMDRGYLVVAGRNSSYSFIPILSKLHLCLGHGLKICMWFGYNPQINFVTFFRKLSLAIFQALSITKCMDRGYLVGTTSHVFWSWSEDMHVFLIYFSDCFCHFFHKLNLAIFQALSITK